MLPTSDAAGTGGQPGVQCCLVPASHLPMFLQALSAEWRQACEIGLQQPQASFFLSSTTSGLSRIWASLCSMGVSGSNWQGLTLLVLGKWEKKGSELHQQCLPPTSTGRGEADSHHGLVLPS